MNVLFPLPVIPITAITTSSGLWFGQKAVVELNLSYCIPDIQTHRVGSRLTAFRSIQIHRR
jgi:hypothetical protein